MGYTENQYNYAKNMLLQLGMEDDELIDKYLNSLEDVYGKMVEYLPYRWGYSVSDCIENIKEELELKKFKYRIKDKVRTNDTITATDLSSYIFCPVSFSIKKSFEIEAPSNVRSTETGLLLHEQLRLVQQITNYNERNELGSIYDEPILKSIIASEVIYTWHDNPNHFFENEIENFRGSPDYIFRDNNGEIFTVEEKFIYKKSNGLQYDMSDPEGIRIVWQYYQTGFFNNHKVQLISYLRNINEYNIKYGYLIYWYYDFCDNNPCIQKFSILKILLDENSELLYQKAKSGILNLLGNSNQKFNIDELNLKKCAACVVSKYCGHKTAKFDDLSLPYSRNYMIKKYVPSVKHKLIEYLRKTFPGSDLKVQFGEIVCTYNFTISTINSNKGLITKLKKIQIATEAFEYIFHGVAKSIWILINSWDGVIAEDIVNEFFANAMEIESWHYNDAKQTFLKTTKPNVNYQALFNSIVSDNINEPPKLQDRIYFIDPVNNIVYMFWDNAIFIGSKELKAIKPIYNYYFDYINEYSRIEFEKDRD